MIHPDKKVQKRQKEFLSQCPSDDREFYEMAMRIGNACVVYSQLANDASPEFLEMCYYEWLEGLKPNIRKVMEKSGFDYCKNTLPFLRYVNERKDIGLKDWLKQHLSETDFVTYELAEKSFLEKYTTEDITDETDDYGVFSLPPQNPYQE